MGRRSLDSYRQKRDPGRTPEPFAATAAPSVTGALRFVVQQHAARRLHWDLRLEIDGVLVSWAVPRGPSIDPKEKRLAVQTEDHPMEYADFEGVIPAGNYGAGAMIVWDLGNYRSLDSNTPAEGLRAGKLDIELRGHKLRGRWALVRTKGSEGKDWLLFKKPEGPLNMPEPVVAQTASVLSGLTVSELGDGVRRDTDLAALAAAAGAPRRALPADALAPMLAETADEPFTRAGWVFELKYDGIRVLIVREAGQPPRLFARSKRNVTVTFPDIAAAAAHLPAESYVIDGEIIALDERGTGSFERLQQRLGLTNPWSVARAAASVPVQVFGFDLLAVAGHDLRALPLTTRKAILGRLLPAQGVIRYADHIEEYGEAFFDEACKHGVEGMVGKRADSAYTSGRRGRDWVKVKAPKRADLAVVGYLPGKGTRQPLGSLMLAWRRGDELVYAGNIGSGLTEQYIVTLLPVLRDAARTAPAFTHDEPLARNAVFVDPSVVVSVRYTEATERGLLRQPVLEAMSDKRVAECDERIDVVRSSLSVAREEPDGDEPPDVDEPNTDDGQRPANHDPFPPAAPRFARSNLTKVFWPAEGYTKGDLLDYYDRIWPAIEPYLRDRPVVLTRYPDGIAGKNFFQKNAPEFVPDWVETCRIEDTEYFLCNEREALLYVINLGCIPLHVWSARRHSIEHPDWAILDLDPKGAPFSDVLAVAHCIHAMLEPLGAEHFIKTSGQDGLHVFIPLGRALTHDEATAFSEVIARLVVAELPKIATIVRPVGGRGGKVYVDFLQNGSGKTIVAPFSVRPRPGATVSMPLAWPEVTPRLDPARFTITTVPDRVGQHGDPMRDVLETSVDVAAVLTALSERLE
jgi:bifunctional non-homologous end joining protein LigD